MPNTISKYELLEELGRSDAGTIHRARDGELQRIVALEVLEGGDGDPVRATRLAHAQAWSRLSHPNLTAVYDLGADGERCFVAMELPDGPTLDRYLAEHPDLAIEEKISIVMQLCGALHYAHERGVVHGNIRPFDIAVLSDGVVKLSDYGIAGARSRRPGGRDRYSPPERSRVDARSDQYSLAAVFEEMLAVAPLVGVDTFLRSAGEMRSIAPGDPLDPSLAAALSRIIARAMSSDPGRRYPDLHALRSELGDILERLALEAWRSGRRTVNARATAALAAWHMASGHRAGTDVSGTDDPFVRAAEWGRANAAVLALSLVAVLSLAAAVVTWEPEPSTSIAAVPSSAGTAARPTPPPPASNYDPATHSSAESSRDRALAARFRSAKAESTRYAPELHLAAQRKELEADAAFNRRDFHNAASLYELARDGYETAAGRAEFRAAAIEKSRIDAQLAAEAAAREVAARQYSPYRYSSWGYSPPTPRPSVTAPIKPLIIEPGDDAYLTLQPPAAAQRPEKPEKPETADTADTPETADTPVSSDERKPLSKAFAAVFAAPSDGKRGGGTWGACWRSDPEAARACARATCEQRRTSDRPCVEAATSKPGEFCVVAKASGFGVSSSACRGGQKEAEAAALAGCRAELRGQRGSGAATCRIAWSSAG